MRPTEYETEVAISAAAQRAYEEERNVLLANDEGAEVPPWDEADRKVREIYVDQVMSAVWAALQALPDRLSPIRQIMHEIDNRSVPQLQWFHGQVTRWLSGSPE